MKNYNINYYYNRGGDKKTEQKYTQNKEKDDENIPILCSAAGGVYLWTEPKTRTLKSTKPPLPPHPNLPYTRAL